MRGFDLVLTNGKILDGQGNTYRLVARASSEAWLRPMSGPKAEEAWFDCVEVVGASGTGGGMLVLLGDDSTKRG